MEDKKNRYAARTVIFKLRKQAIIYLPAMRTALAGFYTNAAASKLSSFGNRTGALCFIDALPAMNAL